MCSQYRVEISMWEEYASLQKVVSRFSSDFLKSFNQGSINFRASKSLCNKTRMNKVVEGK